MLTLIVKLYKTISIKYNLKQIITILNSIAHGVLNILTADMVHDLKNVRSETFSKSSHQLSNSTDNPLDESSFNPGDTTGIFLKSNWYYFTITFLYKTPKSDFQNDTF